MADNVFSGFAEGLNEGAAFATKQVEVDLARKRAEQQQQEFEQQKRQFNVKLGTQYFDKLRQLSTMMPGKAKTAAMKQFSDEASQAGISVDPVFLASLDDPNYKPMFDTLFTGMDDVQSNDKEMFNNFVSGLVPVLGTQGAIAAGQKIVDNMGSIRKAAAAAKQKALDEQNRERRHKEGLAARETRAGQIEERWNKRMAQSAHNQVVNAIKKDTTLRQRLTQFQNLDNALALVEGSENLTPQQVHEFQQVVRRNLGITGQSGVGEREATFINTLGLNAANWAQFLTGDPATLSKDTKLMQHLKDVAKVEQENIRGQIDSQINTMAEGQGHIYEQYPEFKKSLMGLLGAAKGRTRNGVAPPNDPGTPHEPKEPPPKAKEWGEGIKKLKAAWEAGQTKQVLSHPGYEKLTAEEKKYITGGKKNGK